MTLKSSTKLGVHEPNIEIAGYRSVQQASQKQQKVVATQEDWLYLLQNKLIS